MMEVECEDEDGRRKEMTDDKKRWATSHCRAHLLIQNICNYSLISDKAQKITLIHALLKIQASVFSDNGLILHALVFTCIGGLGELVRLVRPP